MWDCWERSSHAYFHIFLWERSSYSVPSLYPLGLYILVAQLTTSCHYYNIIDNILPLMNVFIYLRAVLRIKLGPVIAPDS